MQPESPGLCHQISSILVLFIQITKIEKKPKIVKGRFLERVKRTIEKRNYWCPRGYLYTASRKKNSDIKGERPRDHYERIDNENDIYNI